MTMSIRIFQLLIVLFGGGCLIYAGRLADQHQTQYAMFWVGLAIYNQVTVVYLGQK